MLLAIETKMSAAMIDLAAGLKLSAQRDNALGLKMGLPRQTTRGLRVQSKVYNQRFMEIHFLGDRAVQAKGKFDCGRHLRSLVSCRERLWMRAIVHT